MWVWDTYLRTDAKHFQRRRHVEVLRNLHVAKVDGERLAPDAKVSDVEHGEVAGQRQHDRLTIVTPQGDLFAVFIRHAHPLRGRFRSSADPEFCIYYTKQKNK